jgi:acetyltransferase-like isoleucine patch superfamily enzyme
VGSHVEILQLCLIGHDSHIEDGAVVSGSASVSGGVHIGRCAFIGAAATIRNGLRVGAHALLGMNSTLLEDLPSEAVYAGSPARPVRSGSAAS